MTALAEPSSAPSWTDRLVRIAGVLLAGYAVVLLVVALARSGGHVTEGAAPMVAAAARLDPLRGQVRRAPDAVVIEQPDATGLAVVAARVEPFAAERYDHVEWRFAAATPPGKTVVVLWRTQESPARTFTHRLEWIAPGIAAADLAAEDGWQGTVVALALATQGAIGQPLVVHAMTLSSSSAAGTIRDVVREWSTFFPFRGSSFTFPFDEERTHIVSLVTGTALAEAAAFAAYFWYARRRGEALDTRVLWGIFLAGWLVLDMRWQLNLWKQLAMTARQFAGKSVDEKHHAEDDHQIYELMQRVRAALPAPPVRILFLSDNSTLRTRGGYFLFPHNVYYQFGAKNAVPAFDLVRSGDHVLLLLYKELAYDGARQALIWPDGRAKAVAELLATPEGAVLLRVR